MTSEKNKYKADVLKIAGFAVMSPFGVIVLKIFDESKFYLDFKHFIFFLISILLLYLGVIIVNRGLVHLG